MLILNSARHHNLVVENLESHKHESFLVCLQSQTLGNGGQTLSKCSLHKFVYRGRTNKIDWEISINGHFIAEKKQSTTPNLKSNEN